MSDLLACPFCRELFASGEARACPSCGLKLTSLSGLPPSDEALELETEIVRPELETLPWNYWRRSRGPLLLAAVLGFLVFFAPWVHMSSPEVQDLSGFALAKRTGWMWGACVGWFVLWPMTFTRRSIDEMRGARVAAAFLSAVPLVTVAILLSRPPHSRWVPLRFEWGWGIYATLAIALFALVHAVRLGGRLDDITVTRGSSRGADWLH